MFQKIKEYISDEKPEVYAMLKNGVIIGYYCRRSVLYGYAQGIDDNWFTTKDLILPTWHGPLANRRKVREYLEKNDK